MFREAVKHLDRFTKVYCRDDLSGYGAELVFRCNECEFEMQDGKCLVKVMARKLCPDYKEFRSMGDLGEVMIFPDTVEEFMEQYKIADTKQIYTNGTEFVPIFRMKQWFEHNDAKGTNVPANDMISRQAAIDAFEPWQNVKGYSEGELNMLRAVLYELRNLPPAQPERKMERWIDDGSEFGCCCSECCETLDNYFDGALYEVRLNKIPKFCPNCGAKMEAAERRKK